MELSPARSHPRLAPRRAGRHRIDQRRCRRGLRAGDPGKLWIVAARQGAGQGGRARPLHGRRRRGNIYASLARVEPCAVLRGAADGRYLAASALLDAARAPRRRGVAARLRLKWLERPFARRRKALGYPARRRWALPDGGRGSVMGFGSERLLGPDVRPKRWRGSPSRRRRRGEGPFPRPFRTRWTERWSALRAADPKTRFARLRQDWSRTAGPRRRRARGRRSTNSNYGRVLDSRCARSAPVETVWARDERPPATYDLPP